jgi:L-ribulose-5-phosphate 4-epimerase
MRQDVTRTVHLARQLGTPVPLGKSDVDEAYVRYQSQCGQTDRGTE